MWFLDKNYPSVEYLQMVFNVLTDEPQDSDVIQYKIPSIDKFSAPESDKRTRARLSARAEPVGRIKGALVLKFRLLVNLTHPNPTKGR